MPKKPRRKRKPTKPKAVCAYCHTPFTISRPWQKFCTARCSKDFHAEEQRKIRQFYKEYQHGE